MSFGQLMVLEMELSMYFWTAACMTSDRRRQPLRIDESVRQRGGVALEAAEQAVGVVAYFLRWRLPSGISTLRV